MWFEKDVFRLSYLATPLIPLLLATFSNVVQLSILIPYIIGWSFMSISINLINDYIDKDRKIVLNRKYLLILSVMLIIFGSIILRDAIILGVVYLAAGILYDLKIKGMKYIEVLFLATAISIPYFSLAKIIDWNLVGVIFFILASSILIDKGCDELKYKRLKRQSLILSKSLMMILSLLIIYLSWLNVKYWFLLPLVVFYLGLIIKLKERHLVFNTKVAGIYTSIILLFYIFSVAVQFGMIVL